MSSVAVIGAGAWGTALAIQAGRAGGRVTLWAKYCGFASLGFLLIGAVVWVYRGIIAFNAGLPP